MRKDYLASFGLVTFLAGCGSSDPAGPSATPTPLPAATAVPTQTPAPRPTGDPAEEWKNDGYYQSLAEGPVVKTVCKVRSAHRVDDRTVIFVPPAVQDEEGAWVVSENRYIVLDSDAFNGSDRKCKNDKLPVWEVENDAGAVEEIGGTQPFLYKIITKKRADATFWVTMDGIRSAPLVIRVR